MMPLFNAPRSNNIGNSIRKMLSGRGGLSPLDEIQADAAAADTAHKMGLVEKVRAEVDAMRGAEAARSDPRLQTEYAAHSAGINLPDAEQLTKAIRGTRERPPIENDDEGNRMPDVTYEKPSGLAPGAERSFRSALASAIGTRLATDKTNAAEMAKAGGTLNTTALQNDAANAADVPGANRIIAAITGKIREPFKTNAQGTVLNEETGVLDEAGKLAGVVREGETAKTTRDRAAAGASSAHADLFRAQADKERGKSAGGAKVAPFKDVTTLRKEFNDQKEVQAYRDIIPIVESARGTPNTLAGDIQIAYAVGKILDPASVVREGELKLVGNAATVLEKFKGEIAALTMGKGRLTPKTRASLMQMLDTAVSQRETAYQATENTYRKIAEDNGFPIDQVVINAPKRKELPGKPAPAVNGKGWKLMRDAAGNQAYVSPDGKQFEEVK